MLNRWVLSRDRKTATEGAEVTRSGRLFQTRACSGNRKSSATDGRQSGAADNQWRRWTGTKIETTEPFSWNDVMAAILKVETLTSHQKSDSVNQCEFI